MNLCLDSCILNLESCLLQLSIIIVNYKVRYFLEQCLRTVMNAVDGIDAELIVIDNHSADGSMEYLPPLFPGVRFIANRENRGFARANNQALAVCSGEYVLFLNPDTLIPEDCLHRCLDHMKQYPEAGALGIRMLDGKGRFLPESKRSFPSPLVSFYKLMGLAKLFPKSRIFNRYALGNLDENHDHKVDVLAGAFMLVRKKLLSRLNGFDESYFLYGEDIDLSFRIKEAGYENHYLAGTSIIHFKGESSGNKELSRVKFFYQAMQVFVQKHYKSGAGKLFSVFLQFAIAARAAFSACKRLLRPVALPLIDGLLVWISLQTMRWVWITNIRHGKDFGVAFVPYALPAFSVLFIVCAAFSGLYDKRYKTSQTLLSIAFAALCMLAVYSLLPEAIRFSRGVIMWGGMLGGLVIFILRQLLLPNKNTLFITSEAATEQTVVIATENEYAEITKLFEQAMVDQQLLGRVSTDNDTGNAICSLQDLLLLKKNIPINRIIFCIGKLSLTNIIAEIQLLKKSNTQFLFHVAGSNSIVGSHTLAPGADIVTGHVDYHITHPYQKRMKRVVDILASILLIPTIPFHPRPTHFAGNIYHVIKGSKTWVGYTTVSPTLPPIKKAVISPIKTSPGFAENLLEKADRLYAKNYDWWQDIAIIFQNYRRLG